MPGIFGDETITVPGSPDESGQDDGAAVAAGSEEAFDEEQDTGNQADMGNESEEQVDEQPEDDEQDAPPEGDGQGDGLILGKFKTWDDVGKAYLNLQSEFSRRNQQQGAGQQEPESTAMQQVGDQSAQQPDMNQVFWERFRESPWDTMETIIKHFVQNQTEPIFEERRAQSITANIREVAKEYKQIGDPNGMQQLTDKVVDFAKEFGNPELIRNPSPRILKMAAQELWGDTKSQAFEKGKQLGRTEAERTRQSKQGLGAPNGARRQPAAEPSEEDSIKAGILAAGRGGGLFG